MTTSGNTLTRKAQTPKALTPEALAPNREPNREARRRAEAIKRGPEITPKINPKLNPKITNKRKRRRRYGPAPGSHHMDRRAAQLAAAGTDTEPTPISDDDMLSTDELSRWLGVSSQWCEIGRARGYGPPWKRLSERCIRYRRGDVRAWLEERAGVHMRGEAER